MSHIRTVIAVASVLTGVLTAIGCAAEAGDESPIQGDPQNVTATPGTPTTPAGETAGACNANGTWAMKIVTPVKFNASAFVQAGTGNVTALVKIARTQAGTTITDVGKVCGIDAPDYMGTAIVGSEKYGTRIPAAAFDSPSMPSFKLSVTVSGAGAGATFTAGPTAAIVGASLPNAITDAWPNVAALVAADADGDGKLGLSGDAATGAGFSNLPLNPARSARANRVYIAFRQVIGGATGTVKSCTRAEATGDITSINEHVLGCRREDGTDCAASEFKLLDSVAPQFLPTAKAAITTVKVPDAASCADIRALNFDSIQ